MKSEPNETPVVEEPQERKMVGSPEICKMFGITQETVHVLRRTGRIKGYRLLRQYRYDPDEVAVALEVVRNEGGTRTSEPST